MEAFDWVVVIVGVLAAGTYAWSLATGRVPLRDDRGQVRPIIYIGALGVLCVIVGVLINAAE